MSTVGLVLAAARVADALWFRRGSGPTLAGDADAGAEFAWSPARSPEIDGDDA